MARCLETPVVSQGDTFHGACRSLIEAVELHYEGEDLSGIEPAPAIVPIEVNLPIRELLAG